MNKINYSEVLECYLMINFSKLFSFENILNIFQNYILYISMCILHNLTFIYHFMNELNILC